MQKKYGQATESGFGGYRLSVSANALKNIDEITSYIAFINHHPVNAIKVGDAIVSTIVRIERNP